MSELNLFLCYVDSLLFLYSLTAWGTESVWPFTCHLSKTGIDGDIQCEEIVTDGDIQCEESSSDHCVLIGYSSH